MKEKLYTIPLMDAFKADDECPFCFVERQLEQHTMDFVLGAGASYMEDDVRAETDKMGFCRTHYKKMYDYGNRLGTGLILKTHFQYKTKELHEQIKMFAPSKASVFSRFKKGIADTGSAKTSLGAWAKAQEESCYICNFYKDTYARYLDTFFDLFKKIRNFCLFSKTARAFAFLISGILWRLRKPLCLTKKRKPSTTFCSL